MTDPIQPLIPLSALIRANNVISSGNRLEKAPGSRRFNSVSLGSGVVDAFDWWPTEVRQRLVVVCRDGTVRRFLDHGETVETLAATSPAPATLVASPSTVFVAGGAEFAGRDRKLFLFTGSNQVQVIQGDQAIRRNISSPAADWSTSFPTCGVSHRGRLCAFGNGSDPHRLYMSDTNDQEKFTGAGALSFSVFPGEGEGLLNGYVYQGRLFLFKRPAGAYYLDDTDPDPNNWGIKRLTNSFGAASVGSVIAPLGDMLVANSTGSVTSIKAAQTFGDVESADLLSLLRNESFMRENMNTSENQQRRAVYYPDRKWAMFTYQSKTGIRPDRILVIDYENPSAPRVTWFDKDQPNCLTLRKDTSGVQRPVYGAEDGYVYVMDNQDRVVGPSGAYTGEFQTPHMDFGSNDPGLAERVKLFQHLEIAFEETGAWSLTVDVFIDGKFSETLTFALDKGPHLDTFVLDSSTLDGRTPQSFRKPLHGAGRRISFRCRNANAFENFRIVALNVYFKVAGEEQRG